MSQPSLSATQETSTGVGRRGTLCIAIIRSCSGGGSISDEARGFISLVPCLFHVDNHRDWCRHLFLCNNNSNEKIATNPDAAGPGRAPYPEHLQTCFNSCQSTTMLDITKDIQSLTTFRRRSGDFMKHLKKSQRPVILTVKGKAEAIVQDAVAYQRLLDIAARADSYEGIRQGLEQAKQGKGREVEEFFAEFEARHGISG